VPLEEEIPEGEFLVDYKTFPVCSPTPLREAARPLRRRADLASHVLLDFETIVYGRRWSDWEKWFDAMKIRAVEPAGRLSFSHYDQVIQAVAEDGGVAIGK
jgi:DNA-binding transcriptional LysR family regulator